MRVTARLRLGQTVNSLVWFSSRTAFALLDFEVVSFDPVSLRVQWRWRTPLAGFEDVQRTPTGLVFLVAPQDGSYGPTTLTTLDQARRVRSVLLDGIQAGEPESGTLVLTGAEPGVTVDPETNTAYVVGGGDPVAVVDLRTMTVSYEAAPRTPAVAAHGLTGPIRSATWLGNGLLAVTGVDETVSNGQGGTDQTDTPVGLTIINTRTWTAQLVDPAATTDSQAGSQLLAYGFPYNIKNGLPLRFTGSGLTAYRLDGKSHFHVFGKKAVSSVQVADGLAYAEVSGVGTRVVRLATGQVLPTARLSPTTNLLIQPTT